MRSILFEIMQFVVPNSNAVILKTKNILSLFSSILWIYIKFLNILEKKMIVIAILFRNLPTIRDLFRKLSKKYRFRTLFDSQHVKGFQTLAKGAWEHFDHIFSITLREPDLEIISLSYRLNLRGVS